MSDVIYINGLAEILGKTESSIRHHLQRRSDAIPPAIKIGGRWAWRRHKVEKWLNDKPETVLYKHRKRGRPRGS